MRCPHHIMGQPVRPSQAERSRPRAFLGGRRSETDEAGVSSAVTVLQEGSRLLLGEVQALCSRIPDVRVHVGGSHISSSSCIPLCGLLLGEVQALCSRIPEVRRGSAWCLSVRASLLRLSCYLAEQAWRVGEGPASHIAAKGLRASKEDLTLPTWRSFVACSAAPAMPAHLLCALFPARLPDLPLQWKAKKGESDMPLPLPLLLLLFTARRTHRRAPASRRSACTTVSTGSGCS